MEFFQDTFIDVVLVSGGYPLQYRKGYPIQGLDDLPEDYIIFHAGTKKTDSGIITSGGRVINIVAKGDSLEQAINRVYKECDKIEFKDVFYRQDIGKRDF